MDAVLDHMVLRRGSLDGPAIEAIYAHRLWRSASSAEEARADFLAAPTEHFCGLFNELLGEIGARQVRTLEDAQWREVPEAEFRKFQLNLLRFGEAHNEPRSPLEQAKETLANFFSTIGEPRRLFVNSDKPELLTELGELPPKGPYGWGAGDGISSATFDSGGLAVSTTHVGLLWSFDEE